MTWYDYKTSYEIQMQQYPFRALIMAAMRQADSDNLAKLQEAWPLVWQELRRWCSTPGALQAPLPEPDPTAMEPPR